MLQLLLAEQELLLQLVIHVLLPVQRFLAALVQPLRLLQLGVDLCTLGWGRRPRHYPQRPMATLSPLGQGLRGPTLSFPGLGGNSLRWTNP